MEQMPRARVRTSPEIRRAIQESPEGVRALAARHGLDPKTVRRWRKRSSIQDCKPGPKDPRSKALGLHEEATVIAIRRLTLLPLDDCYYALKALIPGITRATLHRCFRRHGVSRLPQIVRKAARPGGFDLHMLAFGEGADALCMLIAVERVSRYIFAELYRTAKPAPIAEFLRLLAQSAPVRVGTVFTERRGPLGALRGEVTGGCVAIHAAHRTTEPNWNADQIARLDRTMAEAARSRAAEFDLVQLGSRLARFARDYNSSCRLKALAGLTPQTYLSQASSDRRRVRRDVTRGDGSANSPPVSPQRPRARRATAREGTREAILQAARSILSHVGPEGLSMSAAARIAGVNRGTAYQHFQSRKQLIAATAEWSADQLHDAIYGELNRQTEARGAPYEITAVAERLAIFSMENPEMCRAWLFQFLASPNPSEDPFWREWCGAATRFHETPMTQDHIDTEVFSIVQLAGAFLWPTWARAHAKTQADLSRFARRFAEESLRNALFGAIRPDYFPDIVARLQATRSAEEEVPC